MTIFAFTLAKVLSNEQKILESAQKEVWMDQNGLEQPSVKFDTEKGLVQIHLEELDISGPEHQEER